jgi:hypothetical protein
MLANFTRRGIPVLKKTPCFQPISDTTQGEDQVKMEQLMTEAVSKGKRVMKEEWRVLCFT